MLLLKMEITKTKISSQVLMMRILPLCAWNINPSNLSITDIPMKQLRYWTAMSTGIKNIFINRGSKIILIEEGPGIMKPLKLLLKLLIL